MKIRLTLAMAVVAAVAFGQEPGPGPSPSPSPSPGGPGGGTSPIGGGGLGNTNPTNPTQPGRNTFPGQQNQTNFPDMQARPIFLSGKVMMEDGTPPPDSVTIERICNGVVRPEGYTDSKGRFSFELGRNSSMMQDASVSSAGDDPFSQQPGGFGRQGTAMGGFGNRSGVTERDLMGCELRANLPGFRSEMVSLSGRRMLDNPDVGTIIMRRLANVEGFTFSATSGMAPKEAKKSFEKGRDLMKRRKLEEATKELEKATGLYPKYATAWYDLGRLYEAQKRPEDAMKAFVASIEADSKYVSPYVNLALLHGQRKEWEKAADFSAKGIKLNPFEFPQLHYFSAIANLNLNRLDEAEKATTEAQKMDAKGQNLKLFHLMGAIQMQKRDYAGAVKSFKTFLDKAPNAPEAGDIQQQVQQIEAAMASGGAGPAQREAEPEPALVASAAPAATPVSAPRPATPSVPSAPTPRTSWPAWSSGISDLPPVTLSDALAGPALLKKIQPAVYFLATVGNAGQLEAVKKVQGAAVAITSSSLLTSCQNVDAQGVTGVFQAGKLVSGSVRLAKSKRGADMCILEVSGAELEPVAGVRFLQDLEQGEKTFAPAAEGVAVKALTEGKLENKGQQGGIKIVQSSALVGDAAWGGGVFDAFGNLIGITTNRSTGAQAINTAIAVEEFFH